MFILVLGSVLALLHLYVWKRMVKDTTRPGRARWLLTALVGALALLLVGTLIVPRVVGVCLLYTSPSPRDRS